MNLLTGRLADLQARLVGSQAAFEQAETSLRTRVVVALPGAEGPTRPPARAVPSAPSSWWARWWARWAVSVVLVLLLELLRRRRRLGLGGS